jgi:hypothetical protein
MPPGHAAPPIITWAMEAPQYAGPFQPYYRAGLHLLAEAQRDYKSVSTQAKRNQFRATALGLATTFLAAAAGITVLPDGISKWVSAVIAFVAAVISGITTAFAPDRKARKAQAQAVQWLQLRDDVQRYLRRISDGQLGALDVIEEELARLQECRNRILAPPGGTD